jgi:tetratricopeptide (TPR) repeat protein
MSAEDDRNAIRDWNEALRINPQASDAYYYLGENYLKNQNFEQAYLNIRMAAKLEPDNAGSQNNLCWYGSLTGHAREVMDACERAVALSPNAGYIRDSRGLARALTGDYEGAIEDFQYFIRTADGSVEEDERRRDWILQLQNGENPFDDDTLFELLTASWFL